MKDRLFEKRMKQSVAMGEMEMLGIDESGGYVVAVVLAIAGRTRRRSGNREESGPSWSRGKTVLPVRYVTLYATNAKGVAENRVSGIGGACVCRETLSESKHDYLFETRPVTGDQLDSTAVLKLPRGLLRLHIHEGAGLRPRETGAQSLYGFDVPRWCVPSWQLNRRGGGGGGKRDFWRSVSPAQPLSNRPLHQMVPVLRGATARQALMLIRVRVLPRASPLS